MHCEGMKTPVEHNPSFIVVRQTVDPEYGKPARHHQQDCPRLASPVVEEGVHGWTGCWCSLLLVLVDRRRLMNGLISACAGMTNL